MNKQMKNPAAVALGSMTSKKKATAARKNGKKGGRLSTRQSYYKRQFERGQDKQAF